MSSNTDVAAERVAVLARQLCAGSASALSLSVDSKQMREFMTHDNRQLRDAIFEFLKVRMCPRRLDCLLRGWLAGERLAAAAYCT